MATKMIKFDLPMKGVKVTSFDELQENFSADILPIFQTGRLAKWLKSRELLAQSEAIAAIDKNSTELQQLAAICRILELDDDEEVLQFLLDDRQVAQVTPVLPVIEAVEDDSEDAKPPTIVAMDWSGQDLRNRHFIGDDLRHVSLKNADLRWTDFSKADLSGVDLSGVDLSGANLTEANLSSANLSSAKLINANLSKAKLSGTDFNGANLTHVNFSDANLTGATLVDANLKQANLRGSNLTNANLTKADLSGAETILRKWKSSWDNDYSPLLEEIPKVDMEKIEFVNFSSANLTDSNFSSSMLYGANFTMANLTRANFHYAWFYNVNFTKADLSFATFTGLDFGIKRCDKSSAKLNLTNAKLTGVINFDRPKEF